MRTTVDIDKPLLERLRDRAHQEGVPFKELLNRILRRGLEAPPEHLEPYRCPTFAMGEPYRSLDRALKLADAMADDEVARKMALRK